MKNIRYSSRALKRTSVATVAAIGKYCITTKELFLFCNSQNDHLLSVSLKQPSNQNFISKNFNPLYILLLSYLTASHEPGMKSCNIPFYHLLRLYPSTISVTEKLVIPQRGWCYPLLSYNCNAADLRISQRSPLQRISSFRALTKGDTMRFRNAQVRIPLSGTLDLKITSHTNQSMHTFFQPSWRTYEAFQPPFKKAFFQTGLLEFP